MSTSNTKTTYKEKSQYAILSHNFFSAKEGTIAFKDSRISFTDYDGNILVDLEIADIQEYKQYNFSLSLITSNRKYRFIFFPSNPKKSRKNILMFALHPGSRLGILERQVNDSGIMGWVRLLVKNGVHDARRNSFAYSLLFVIVPILIFASLALFGNITAVNATSTPRSYTELLVELVIIGVSFAGFAYVFKSIRKNNAK